MLFNPSFWEKSSQLLRLQIPEDDSSRPKESTFDPIRPGSSKEVGPKLGGEDQLGAAGCS